MKSTWRERLPIVSGLLLAGAFLASFAVVDEVQEATLALLAWVEGIGGWGIAFYFFLYVAIVLFLIPGIVFTVGAGFLFGVFVGGIVIIGALAAGSGLAFLIARYLVGERVARKVQEHPRVRLLDKGLQKEGWKIVFLSRLLPIFPFKLSNYFLGLTGIPFRHFFFANLVGVIPLSMTNVYVGSLTADLTRLMEREPQPWEWAFYVATFVATLGLIYYITRIARRAMANALAEEE